MEADLGDKTLWLKVKAEGTKTGSDNAAGARTRPAMRPDGMRDYARYAT